MCTCACIFLVCVGGGECVCVKERENVCVCVFCVLFAALYIRFFSSPQFPGIAVGNAELVHMIVENIDGTQVTIADAVFVMNISFAVSVQAV